MVLCPLSIALRGVELRSLDFGGESLKVGADDVRGWQLLHCGGFKRSACFYLLLAFPPTQLSGLSHDTLACGPQVGLLDNSRGDRARRNMCAPYTYFGRREGGQGCRSRRRAVFAKSAGLPDKTGFFSFCPAKTFSLSDKCPMNLNKENNILTINMPSVLQILICPAKDYSLSDNCPASVEKTS